MVMTLKEKALADFENVLETTDIVLEAGDNGLTYYELRQFLAILLRNLAGSDTKKVVDDLLKTVSKLEIMRVPVPVIKKQKTVSPVIFK
jgi:hypothetical protein